MLEGVTGLGGVQGRRVHVQTCKERQRRRSKPKRENKLFFITIYYKKRNMLRFYGSFYGH